MSTGHPARKRPPRSPQDDYRQKTRHEARHVAQLLKEAGHPEPLGDPTSGLLIVVSQPIGPRLVDALERSLEAVNLPEAYVTWSSTSLLREEILSLQPSTLVSVGPEAARDIDSLDYPLARDSFSEAAVGEFFSWTGSTSGLALPALAPALDDERAKKSFWHAFLALQRLSAFSF